MHPTYPQRYQLLETWFILSNFFNLLVIHLIGLDVLFLFLFSLEGVPLLKLLVKDFTFLADHPHPGGHLLNHLAFLLAEVRLTTLNLLGIFLDLSGSRLHLGLGGGHGDRWFGWTRIHGCHGLALWLGCNDHSLHAGHPRTFRVLVMTAATSVLSHPSALAGLLLVLGDAPTYHCWTLWLLLLSLSLGPACWFGCHHFRLGIHGLNIHHVRGEQVIPELCSQGSIHLVDVRQVAFSHSHQALELVFGFGDCLLDPGSQECLKILHRSIGILEVEVDLARESHEMSVRRHVCWFWLPRVLLL